MKHDRNKPNFMYSVQIATEEQAQRFNANHRAVLPAIYNANLSRYNWHAPTPTPTPDEHLLVKVKLEDENTQLKETIVHLQNRIGAEDLTVDEMQDIQETLMDDDDGLEWLQNPLPRPIGSIKTEPVANDEFEVSSMDDFVQAEDNGISPNTSQKCDDSSFEPIANTSNAIASTSNGHQNTFVDSSVDTTTSNGIPHNIVTGSIELVLDVRKVDMPSVYISFDKKSHYNVIIINDCSQANLGRFFPCANATMPAVTYGLLEYYNDVQILRGIGEVFDLKYIHITLKGFFGIEKMSEMVEIDFNDPVLLLAKRKFYTVFFIGNKK